MLAYGAAIVSFHLSNLIFKLIHIFPNPGSPNFCMQCLHIGKYFHEKYISLKNKKAQKTDSLICLGVITCLEDMQLFFTHIPTFACSSENWKLCFTDLI